MSDFYAATDGTAGGNGSRSMPYDLDSGVAAIASGDRLIVMPGLYAQTLDVTTAGVTVEGHSSGVAMLYGGAQITGTWELHSGSVWKISTTAPTALILRTHSNLMLKGELMDSLAEVVDERHWYHTGGYLYLYSGGGNPSVAYWRIDKTSLQGTASQFYAPAKGGLFVEGDDITLRRLAVRGFAVNGHMMDGGDAHLIEGCDFSFNAEDGGGGFAMPNCILRDSRCDWNGTRRPRLGELGSTDGDGFSTHDGGAQASTNHLIQDCGFEGNIKDAVQNIGGATGTMERCKIKNCGFGLVLSTTGAQTFRNIVIESGEYGLNAFALIAGTGTVQNLTCIGRDLASSKAVVSVFGVGTLDIKNSIFTGWPTGSDMSTSTFTHTYNVWDVTTLGHTLGTGEVQADPQIEGSRFRLALTSPAYGTGTSLAASFTDDVDGRTRFSTWSMGAVERVTTTPRGRAVEALCTALEGMGAHTLDDVTKVVRYGQTTEGAITPYVVLTATREALNRLDFHGAYDRTLTAEFVYVASESWESEDFVPALIADVETALADHTLGGVVDDVRILTNTSRVDGVAAAVAFAIELRYRTSDTSPLTRV